MRTPLSRVLVGTTVTATALLTLAGTASATTVKTPTHLKISESATSITVGHTDVISGTLTANGKGLAKRAVVLDRWAHARWIPVAAKATNSTGMVKFAAKPMHSTRYRLFYHGDAKYARAASVSVPVTVTKIPTALAATASASSIKAGQKDTIKGTLTKGTSPLAKRVVWIYRLVTGKRPYRMQAHLTNAKGVVSFTVAPKATTSYELVYFGTKMLAHSVSTAVTVTVTP